MIKFFKGLMLCAITIACLLVLKRETEIIEVLKTGFTMIGLILYYKFLIELWGNEK